MFHVHVPPYYSALRVSRRDDGLVSFDPRKDTNDKLKMKIISKSDFKYSSVNTLPLRELSLIIQQYKT